MLNDHLAIKVRNLTKSFHWYRSPADAFKEILLRRPKRETFTALNDISLEIGRGEVVGIIGRNGAGKSTLLKIIAGTLTATSGAVNVNGRVSAILELGTGFHPERTGRENAIVSGLCLGFTKAEVLSKLDEVIAFAELEAFIDRPLKTYSTGMKARLAFGVATAIEPDILIVDEALSVGDAKFERKSFARFEDYKKKGKTILLVSHSTGVVEMVCDRAVYLEHGRVKMVGSPKSVVAEYMQDLFGPATSQLPPGDCAPPVQPDSGAVAKRYGTGGAEILTCQLLDADGNPVAAIATGSRCKVRVVVRCHEDYVHDLNIGITFKNTHGVTVFATNPIMAEKPSFNLRAGDVLEVTCAVQMNLGVGDYFITTGAWAMGREHHLDRRTDIVHFYVIGPPGLRESIANLYPDYRGEITSAHREAL